MPDDAARPTIRAVILDLDDTLFDHTESARRGLTRTVAELGGQATTTVLDSWETTAERLMGQRRRGLLDREGYRRERVRALLLEIGIPARAAESEPRQLDQIYDRFLTLYEQEWVGFDDAVPMLRALQSRGLALAILTNGPEERQQRKVQALGLAPWVVSVWTSDRLGARKPDERTYLAVCEALAVEPCSVLHVGDNREHDLDGARSAGLAALHLDRSRQRPLAPDSIGGLLDVLDRL